MGTPVVVGRGIPAWPPWPAALPQPGCLSPQGVILCFGLCARGQVKTVLNVLHDFEERIQESEQSWQIGAWRVSRPGSTIRPPGAPQNSALRPQPRLLPGHRKKLPSVSPSAGEGGHWTQAAEGRPLEAASPGSGQQGAVPQAAGAPGSNPLESPMPQGLALTPGPPSPVGLMASNTSSPRAGARQVKI